MIRSLICFPLLFAMWPILSLFAENRGQLFVQDLALPLLVTIGVAAVAWFLATKVLHDKVKAGIVVAACAVLFLLYGPLDELFINHKPFSLLAPKYSWLLLLATGALIFWRLERISDRMVTSIQVVAVILVAIPVFHMAFSESRLWLSQRKVVIKSRLSSNTIGVAPGQQPSHPNIYYIIVDGYARADVLSSRYSFDNTEFMAALTNRGFFVAQRSYANYCQTLLSLTTSLNMEYVERLQHQFNLREMTRDIMPEFIHHSRVRKILAGYGYRFVAFATGYGPTEIRSADEFHNVSGPSPFASAVIGRTPLTKLDKLFGMVDDSVPYNIHRLKILRILNDLGRINDRQAPVFVFAHIIAPHPPFVFRRDGHPVRSPRSFELNDGNHYEGTKDEYRKAYLDQLVYLNGEIIKTVDAILRSQTRPTMIILQADHGPGSGLDFESLERSDLVERFGILQAYYFPDQAYEKLWDGISPVNTFRFILSNYFREDLPNLPDESFFSSWTKPFDYSPISDKLVH